MSYIQALTEATEERSGYSPYRLADMADCGSPDRLDSSGALFLCSVRDAVMEHVTYAGSDWDDDSMPDMIEKSFMDNGIAHEIADGAPDVYTFTRWAEFVDLAAYQEVPEFGEWPEDLTDAAGVALYQIAERLVSALVAEVCEHLRNYEPPHVNYPHNPGYLHDCPACESRCYCTDDPGHVECVYCAGQSEEA